MKLFVFALVPLAVAAGKHFFDDLKFDAVTFLEADQAFQPNVTLLASQASVPQCTLTSPTTNVGTTSTLQVLVSTCLSDDQLAEVRAWIPSVWPTAFNLLPPIEVVPVAGACKPKMLMSDEQAVDRFTEIFGDIGTIIDLFGSPKKATNASMLLSEDSTTPIGIVSFVDTPTSLQIAQEYKNKNSAAAALVIVCDATHPCPASCNTDSCITTANIITVDTYRITKILECPDQPHAFPASYLHGGKRECVCQCELGWKRGTSGLCDQQVGNSVSSCSWATNPFVIRNSAQLGTCSFSNIVTNGVTAPVAIDNYVGKHRTSQGDPHIELKTSRISEQRIVNVDAALGFPSDYPSLFSSLTVAQKQGAVVETDGVTGATPAEQTFSWVDYQSNRPDKINSLTYTSYGKYAIELDAKDYKSTATCQGCLSIVDDFRPTATSPCTSATSSDLEPTLANVQTVNTKIESYFAFKDTNVLNDACSLPRCDEVHVQVQPILGSTYIDSTNDHTMQAAQTYFSHDAIRSEVMALGEISDSELVTELSFGQCKRCLKMTTALKEWWIDYSCARDYSVKKCEGNSGQTCAFEQCNVLSGSTISAAQASIKPTVQSDSQLVFDQIEDTLSFNTLTQVHFALSHCKEFAAIGTEPSAECMYSASLSDLFAPESPDAGVLGFTPTDLASVVKWRYKIGTEPWGVWGASVPSYDFKQAVTSVVLEAWTKCGRVFSFDFKVHLHLSAPSHVCDFFPSMWYQTVHIPDTPSTSFCMYPKADFAEVTFDYEANIGLMYAKDKLNMNIKAVECRLRYSWLPSSSVSASFISSTASGGSILERFEVLGRRSPTIPSTEFDVECDFKYEVYGSSDLYVQTCSHDYSIVDCTDPKIDEPSALTDKSCAVDSCAATTEPGAYEACGGNIVSVIDDNTVFNTAEDQTCCQFCSPSYVTSCKKLPQLPDEPDIKLCIPSANTPAADDYDDGPNLLLAAQAHVKEMVASPTMMLIGASAMVVAVALFVERRRRADANIMNADAYYELLG